MFSVQTHPKTLPSLLSLRPQIAIPTALNDTKTRLKDFQVTPEGINNYLSNFVNNHRTLYTMCTIEERKFEFFCVGTTNFYVECMVGLSGASGSFNTTQQKRTLSHQNDYL